MFIREHAAGLRAEKNRHALMMACYRPFKTWGPLKIKKYVLSSELTPAPITEPVSKLGGQPVWVDAPQWPLSRATGKPMSFV